MPGYTLPDGTGYWDLTHYPVGGCFRRVTGDTALSEVKPFPVGATKGTQGCTHWGHLPNGTRIAFNAGYTLEAVAAAREEN